MLQKGRDKEGDIERCRDEQGGLKRHWFSIWVILERSLKNRVFVFSWQSQMYLRDHCIGGGSLDSLQSRPWLLQQALGGWGHPPLLREWGFVAWRCAWCPAVHTGMEGKDGSGSSPLRALPLKLCRVFCRRCILVLHGLLMYMQSVRTSGSSSCRLPAFARLPFEAGHRRPKSSNGSGSRSMPLSSLGPKIFLGFDALFFGVFTFSSLLLKF